ncbi:hypothetical protein SALBM217S_06411 [Streptomyces griseoloalbus]
MDALVTGHAHNAYVYHHPRPGGQPPAWSPPPPGFGRLYTDTTLTYDRRTGDIARTAVKSANRVVSRDVPKAPDMTRLIDKWNTLTAPIGNRAIGYASPVTSSRTAPSPRWATSSPTRSWRTPARSTRRPTSR